MTLYSDCTHTINTKTQEIQHTGVPPTVQESPSSRQKLGAAVGFAEGIAVGPAVGFAEGWAVGLAVGEAVGSTLGIAIGDTVGPAVGPAIGDTLHFFPLQGLGALGALVLLPPLSTRTAET
jgi:hypothetical protein